ncbi:MAG TPA: tyrosine-type recombinase/integrase [Xanthobacteraceae bacterium]|nr:tyrosine-type recombinase/integrase [Xanthobacteraceae bacterium]
MSRIKLEFVQAFVDRYGRARHYFRRRGHKRVPLPGLPGSDEFMKAYRTALSGEPEPIEIGASRTMEGTVNAIVAAYLDCTEKSSSPFKTFAPETQRTRRNILENFRTRHGDKRIFRTEGNGKRVMLLMREHMQRIVNEKAATPFAQRNFLNTLNAMFDWAAGEGRVPENPTLGVKRQKAKTTGYKTWSEADIERFEAKHAIGTKGRLALALLLYTGQRRSDVVQMGPQHIHKGLLTIDQRKTEGTEESHLEIPVHPKLTAIIDATPTVGLKTFLVTSFGKPYSSAGFGNWFRELCDEADCADVSAHGLRKACARRLAELGCSAHEIASITGHASLGEVERYTKAANRKRLAGSAMQKLVEGGS